MSNVVSSPELALYRTPGKFSIAYAAILKPPIIYRARINQTFSSLDIVLTIIYDTGSGTLANVLPDMEVWIGTAVDTYDKGICRLRDKDATHFYLSETSEITFADNDYVTIVANFGVWARPVRTPTPTTFYIDETLYTDQHTNWDPIVNMGSHQVVEMTGSFIDTGWYAGTSYCPGSSISAWAWSAPDATASSGTTTNTATFRFNTVGWHLVYLTVTAANGKSFFGVRYVYVWNKANPPSKVVIDRLDTNVDSGGWTGEFTMRTGASLTDFYERAMVIIFTKDYYGTTQQNIGPVLSSENIIFVGWIYGESTLVSGEDPSVKFSAGGAQYWMGKIPSWPDGVEIRSTTSDWTNVPSLIVDHGVYHHLRWRSTLTRVADIQLTGDTRIAQEVSSSAQNLWAQLQEMCWNTIYARIGFNAQGQFSAQIHPNLIPTGSRTAPTVMAITKSDIRNDISFERSTVADAAVIDMSGVVVTSFQVGTALFALSPGHSLPHYGNWDLQPNLLLSNQSQVNTLAGLYRAWKNAPFKNIPLQFAAKVNKLDCFPNMKCTISLSASDNLRGWALSGGIIPTEVRVIHDAVEGYMYTEASFEQETFETSAITGDTPGSGDTSHPPDPSFPPLPDIPSSFPGVPTGTNGGPKRVLFLDTGVGLVYSENFDAIVPTYVTVNSGLSFVPFSSGSLAGAPVRLLIRRFFVTPNGAVYVFCNNAITQGSWSSGNIWFGLWYAPSIGATFVPIFDWTTVNAAIGAPGFSDNARGLYTVGYNPLVSEQVMYITHELNDEANIYLGGALTFPKTYTGTASTLGSGAGGGSEGGLSFALNQWLLTGYNRKKIINSSGVLSSTAGLTGITLTPEGHSPSTVPASTTGITFHPGQDPFTSDLLRGVGNLTTSAWLGPPAAQSWLGLACDPSGNFLCGRYLSGKSKSTDGGATWTALASLPVGNWYFAYAGPGTSVPRFLAANALIKFSEDMFSTYTEKMASTYNPGITATPNIAGLQVLEY